MKIEHMQAMCVGRHGVPYHLYFQITNTYGNHWEISEVLISYNIKQTWKGLWKMKNTFIFKIGGFTTPYCKDNMKLCQILLQQKYNNDQAMFIPWNCKKTPFNNAPVVVVTFYNESLIKRSRERCLELCCIVQFRLLS